MKRNRYRLTGKIIGQYGVNDEKFPMPETSGNNFFLIAIKFILKSNQVMMGTVDAVVSQLKRQTVTLDLFCNFSIFAIISFMALLVDFNVDVKDFD